MLTDDYDVFIAFGLMGKEMATAPGIPINSYYNIAVGKVHVNFVQTDQRLALLHEAELKLQNVSNLL